MPSSSKTPGAVAGVAFPDRPVRFERDAMARRRRLGCGWGCLVVVLAVAVAVIAVLGLLQGVTNAKPISHFRCWIEETDHQHFGGRERLWDNTRHVCRDGSHYYK